MLTIINLFWKLRIGIKTFLEGRRLFRIEKGILCPDPDRLKLFLKLKSPEDNASMRSFMEIFAYYWKWIPKFS